MKRIKFQCLFVILSISMLTSCSIFKEKKTSKKNTYLYLERAKAVSYNQKYYEIKNEAILNKTLDSTQVEILEFSRDIISDFNNIAVPPTLIKPYAQEFATELKCCDPLAGDDCTRKCACNLISLELAYIISNEEIITLTISKLSDGSIVDTLKTDEGSITSSGTYLYPIELAHLVPGIEYVLYFKISINQVIKDYTAFITVY